MRPSEVLQSKREIVHAIIARHRVANVRVFGSALRGEDREGSDLDLLVDAAPDASLLDLVKAQREIEQELGITVELLTPDDLPESFRRQVLGQAKPL